MGCMILIIRLFFTERTFSTAERIFKNQPIRIAT